MTLKTTQCTFKSCIKNNLRVDGMYFLSIDEHVLIYRWRNYLYVRPVNSTDHTGHTCNCHEVGFDPV